MADEIGALANALASFEAELAASSSKTLTSLIRPEDLVGDLIKMDYAECDVLVHDHLRQKVGGLPLGCFLLSTRLTPKLAPAPTEEDTSSTFVTSYRTKPTSECFRNGPKSIFGRSACCDARGGLGRGRQNRPVYASSVALRGRQMPSARHIPHARKCTFQMVAGLWRRCLEFLLRARHESVQACRNGPYGNCKFLKGSD